jgi:phosphoribosylaminoimidazole-succinocarboxamide synthase
MEASAVAAHLGHTLPETRFEGLGHPYRGKVRDTYLRDEALILVASDRISAFDHILKQTIPFKGQVLTRLAAFFFQHTADLVPNHIIAVPDPNVTIAVPCATIPIEFVVRGYLAGHAWREYRSGARMLCGNGLFSHGKFYKCQWRKSFFKNPYSTCSCKK